MARRSVGSAASRTDDLVTLGEAKALLAPGVAGGFGPNWIAAYNSAPSIKDAVLAAGGKVCDYAGDQVEFNSQLSAFGHVVFATGDYKLDASITPPAKRFLQGSGPLSEFKGGAALTGAFIKTTNVDHVWLRDFSMTGLDEAAGTHHIHSDATTDTAFWTGSDACIKIDNITSRYHKGNALRMTGSFNRDSKIHSIHAWNGTGTSYFLDSPDGKATGLISGTAGGHGAEIPGTNWHVSGKMWYADGNGWYVTGSRITLVDTEAQDNEKAGYLLRGNSITMTGFLADSNSYIGASGGTVNTNVFSGVEVGELNADGTTYSGGYDISLSAGQAYDKNEGARGYRQRSGIRLRSGVRGLTMSGIGTGDSVSNLKNVTAGIEFVTSTDLNHTNNAVSACLNHRVRMQSA